MATPDLATDLALIARQEADLRFPSFDYDTAWRVGLSMRELAHSRKQSIVIDIRRFGQPHQPLFYTALGGTPDNARWVQRKSNVVARFPSLLLRHRPHTRANQPHSSATATTSPMPTTIAHGGCFPIHVVGAGIIGCITVSGLTQREDHNLVVEALCLELHKDHGSLRLPPHP